MGRSDVVEHQLVGTGAGVVLRQSHRVGHVPEPLKIDSLYHPSVPYIQATSPRASRSDRAPV